jgi:phosphoribosylamine--glycine ligase
VKAVPIRGDPNGPDDHEARARAYAAVEQIHFYSMQYRTDIALEAMELEDF